MVATPVPPSGTPEGEGRSRRKRAEAAAAVPADEVDTALLRQFLDIAECVSTKEEKIAIDDIVRQLAGSHQVVFEGADREAVKQELVARLAPVANGVLTPLLDRLLDGADAAQPALAGTELLERALAASAAMPLVPGIASLKAPPNADDWPEWARRHRLLRQCAATLLQLRNELAKEARRSDANPGLSLERLGLEGDRMDPARERLTACAVSALVAVSGRAQCEALLLALDALLAGRGSRRRFQGKEGQGEGAARKARRPAFGGQDTLRNGVRAVLTEHAATHYDKPGAGAAVWAPWVAAYVGDLQLVGILAGGLLDGGARSGSAALAMRHAAGALRAEFPAPPAAAAAALARRRRTRRGAGTDRCDEGAAAAPLLMQAANPAGGVVAMRSPYAGRGGAGSSPPLPVADPWLWWRLPSLFGLQEFADTLSSPSMLEACELATVRRLRNSQPAPLLVAAQSERLALEGMLWRTALGCRPRSETYRAKRAAKAQADGEVKTLLSLLRRELPTGKQAVLRQAVMRARVGCRDGGDLPDAAALARLTHEVLALLGPSAPAFFSLVDRCAAAITLQDVDHHMPGAKRTQPSAGASHHATGGGRHGGAGGFSGSGDTPVSADALSAAWALPAVGATEVEAASRRLSDRVTPAKLADILVRVLPHRALQSVRYRLKMLGRAVQADTRARLRLEAVDLVLSSLGGLSLPLQGAVEGCIDVLSPEMLDAAQQAGAAASRGPAKPALPRRATGRSAAAGASSQQPAGAAASSLVGASAAAELLAEAAAAEGKSLLGPGLPPWVLAMYTEQAARAQQRGSGGGEAEDDGLEGKPAADAFLGPWGRVRAVEAAGGTEEQDDQERAETFVVAETRKLVLPLRFRVHRVHSDTEAQRLGQASLQLAQTRVLDALLASGALADVDGDAERTASSRALMWDTLQPHVHSGATSTATGVGQGGGGELPLEEEQLEHAGTSGEEEEGEDPLGLGWGGQSLVDPEPEQTQLAVSSGVAAAPVARRTVMLCDLPLNAREEDVRLAMERCGATASVRMESGRSDRLLAILRKEAAAADRKAGDRRKGRRTAGRPRGAGAERRMAKMEAARLDKLQAKYPKHAFVTFEDEASMKAALSPEVGVFGMVVGSRACSVVEQQACKYVHISNAPKRHKPIAVLALLAQALAPLGLELRAADSAVMAADLQSSGDVLLEADDHLAARDIVGLLGGHSLVPGETMVVGWSTEKEYGSAKPRLPPSLTKPRQSAAGRGDVGQLVTIDTAYSSADLERAVRRSPVGWEAEPAFDRQAVWGAVGAGLVVPRRRSAGLGDR